VEVRAILNARARPAILLTHDQHERSPLADESAS